MHRTHALTLLLVLAGASMAARPTAGEGATQVTAVSSLTAQVDKLFAAWDRRDRPGCALVSSGTERWADQRGYGMANLEYDVPITPATVFNVGSVTKQFTAFCIHRLARDGKLSLDDDARKYLPELHDFGAKITIRHCCTTPAACATTSAPCPSPDGGTTIRTWFPTFSTSSGARES